MCDSFYFMGGEIMNEKYMKMALKEAQKAYQEDEVPIGAIIVQNGNVIAICTQKQRQAMKLGLLRKRFRFFGGPIFVHFLLYCFSKGPFVLWAAVCNRADSFSCICCGIFFHRSCLLWWKTAPGSRLSEPGPFTGIIASDSPKDIFPYRGPPNYNTAKPVAKVSPIWTCYRHASQNARNFIPPASLALPSANGYPPL